MKIGYTDIRLRFKTEDANKLAELSKQYTGSDRKRKPYLEAELLKLIKK